MIWMADVNVDDAKLWGISLPKISTKIDNITINCPPVL